MKRSLFVGVCLLALFALAGGAWADEGGARKVIGTDKAPAAIGPYSQAIQAGDFLYVSGQIPVDPATGEVVEGGVEAQARQSLENVKAVLEAAGYGMQDVVKTTVFAADMGDFATVNGIYAQYFEKDPPARSFVAVKALPRAVLVEIEVVAFKK